jgi:hypothetical protein
VKHTALPAALMAWLTTTAIAGELNVHDKEFVTAAVLTAHVLDHCKDYEVVVDGFLPFGDLNGIDPRTGRAVYTAFKMFAGMAYDRNLLIPEVTAAMIDIDNEVTPYETANPEAFCWQWGPSLMKKGLVRKKGEAEQSDK